jgi:NADPH:quinone reductase-like Zn-dependent oxidoreductase
VRAITYQEYGTPEVLELRDVEQPVAGEGEVLVHVAAASVNPLDWHVLTGVPYLARAASGLRRPRTGRLGADFAGTVGAVSAGVTRFEPGDDVFGVRNGTFAEYVCVPADGAIAPKPANVSFEEAAAAGLAAVTALQGLRDKGGIRSARNVLVNGASGGVGTFAVQIAKSFGANVTAVCSPRKVERARSLGADHVLDYTRDDFTRIGRRFDLMLDVAFNRTWADYKRALNPEGILVGVGGPKTNRWVGALGRRLRIGLAAAVGSRKAPFFVASPNSEDQHALAELLESGRVTPFVERGYELSELREALEYVAKGHAHGKVVVTP